MPHLPVTRHAHINVGYFLVVCSCICDLATGLISRLPPLPFFASVPQLWDTRYALLPLQAAGRSESSCRRKGDIGSSSASTKPVSSSPALTRRNSEPQRRRGKVVRGPEGWRAGGGIVGGDAIAKEAAADGGRPYGVSSVHTCDDGSRIAVSSLARTHANS